MKPMKVTIIGSGNVAEAFARALATSPHEVVQVYARNGQRGQVVAQIAGSQWCSNKEELKASELYIVCVSDRAIAEVTAALPIPEGAIVAHTAGCGTLEDLPKTARRAIIYPFQTFTAGRIVNFRELFIFTEGQDEQTLDIVTSFARTLSDNVTKADALLRSKIHLTGVFASNFVNNIYATATEVLADAGLGFEVIAPLIAQTAAKAIESRNPSEVQTGPAVRGDIATMERHRELLADKKLLRTIYDKLSENIWRIKETSKR